MATSAVSALVSHLPRSTTLVFVLLAFLALVLLRLFLFPPSRQPLSLTEANTLFNRRENGGTGVYARKIRRALLPPLRYGDEDELKGAGLDGEEGEKAFEGWNVRMGPVPSGLKGCLRRAEVFELALKAAVLPDSTLPSSPSTDEKPASSSPISSPSPLPPPSPPPRSSKTVRVIEPSLVELEALRELWASPEMQAQGGQGGIGGYRRTRDFYSKSQGGKAVIKRAGAAAAAGGAGEKEKEKKGERAPSSTPLVATSSTTAHAAVPVSGDVPTTKEDSSSSSRPSVPRRISPRLSIPASASSNASSRTASLSPSPITRRPGHVRTLSPSSGVKVSPQRRRAASIGRSASPAGGAGERNASPAGVGAGVGGGGGGAAGAVPRWVKTRGGRVASPAPARVASTGGEGETEEEVTEFEETEEEEEQEGEDSPVWGGGAGRFPSSPASSDGGSERGRELSSDVELDSPTPSLLLTCHPLPPLSAPAKPSLRVDLPSSSSFPPSPVTSSSPTTTTNGVHDPLPALVVSPSTPPLSTASLPSLSPSSSSPCPSPSPTSSTASSSPASSASPTTTSSQSSAAPPSPSPSPCVQKERRLSLRVQQSLGKKERQREASLRAAGVVA
ncbi:hypothetical protein JCM8547_002240 [Rhodosporidiobolus lusitaniae]